MAFENALVAPGVRVLVLAAHTDDEFGCAGTVHRMLRAGAEVHYLALSRCEESVPEGNPEDILETECRECWRRLGVPDEHVDVRRFQVRHFPRDRQEILESFVAARREWTPDVVLVPCSQDIHQDHAVVHAEGLRAFKHATVLGYELPQNLTSFTNSALVRLDEEDLAAKVHALSAYASQEFRPYSDERFIRGLARVRGVQGGLELAEAFEVVRLTLR